MAANRPDAPDQCRFEELIPLYQRKLYRIAYSIIGNGSDAQDIVQETFLRAYQHWDRLRDPARSEAWLCRITVNLCRSWLRHQRVHLNAVEFELGREPSLHVPLAPDEHLIQAELSERIRQAVEQLPPRQREVIQLFYVEGLSYQKIQDRLGISKGLLGCRLNRARERLQQKLEHVYRALVPAWILRLHCTSPSALPFQFLLLSLFLHLALWLSAPRIFFTGPGTEDASQSTAISVSLVEQSMLRLSGDSIAPQRISHTPEPDPLPRPVQVQLLPQTMQVSGSSLVSFTPPQLHDTTASAWKSLPFATPSLSVIVPPASAQMTDGRAGLPMRAFRFGDAGSARVVTGPATEPGRVQADASSQISVLFTQSGRLVAMDLSSNQQRGLWLPPTKAGPWYSRLAVSPDGTKAAFSSAAPGTQGIWLQDLTRREGPRKLAGVMFTSERELSSPAWSPDGRQVAFVSATARRMHDIWAIRIDGSQCVQLTQDTGSNTDPAWSPDGARLAFASRGRQYEVSDIFVLEIATGQRTQLTRDAGRGIDSREPAWSPAGSIIAYTRYSQDPKENGTIYLMDADGRNKHLLVNDGTQPAWSPDGSQILFLQGQDDQSEVSVIGVDGQRQRQITHNEAAEGTPQWLVSPAGSDIPEPVVLVSTPAILLPCQEGSRVVFLRFLNARELITVRQWRNNEMWYIETRTLDAPNAVTLVSLPGSGVRGLYQGQVMRADIQGSQIFVEALQEEFPHNPYNVRPPSVTAYYWDGEQVRTFPSSNWISFNFLPDGSPLVIERDGRLKVAAIESQSPAVSQFDPNTILTRVQPRTGLIVSTHLDDTIAVWEPHTYERLRNIPTHQVGIRDRIRDLALSEDEDAPIAVSCASNGSVSVWDLSTGDALGTVHAGMVEHVAISPDRKWIAVSGPAFTLLWELATLELVSAMPGGGVLAFSPDSHWLANVRDHSDIAVWQLTD